MFQSREQCEIFLRKNRIDLLYICVADTPQNVDPGGSFIRHSINKNLCVLYHFSKDIKPETIEEMTFSDSQDQDLATVNGQSVGDAPAQPEARAPSPGPEHVPADHVKTAVSHDGINKISKILLADEDRELTKLIISTLKQHGYHTMTASDGKEALDMMKTGDPDLLIMDIVMPKYSGTEVTQMLRKDKKLMNKPVLLMTASTDEDMKAIAMNSGATGFLRKPFKMETMIATIKGLLDPVKPATPS